MKNILQENMKRFATKNLTESDSDSNNNGYPDDTEDTTNLRRANSEHIWKNRRATTETIDLQTAIHRYQEFLKTDQYAYDTLGYSDEDAAIFEAAWKLTKRNENKLKQGT